jgi:stage III sporulation protein AE
MRLAIVPVMSALSSLPVDIDITAPPLTEPGMLSVPEAESFGEGLLMILKDLLPLIRPDIHEASAVCVSIICAVMLCSVLRAVSADSEKIADTVTVVCISATVLYSMDSMIRLAEDTVIQMSGYCKMLIPVMTTALAAQGAPGTSAALCAGTLAADTVMIGAVSGILLPCVYIFLAFSVAAAVTGEEIVKKCRDLIRNVITFFLKTSLSVFVAYMGVTVVISGTTDAAALKVTKATISMFVPVVGGILSDAAGSVLIGVKLAKNAAGIYGVFALLTIFLEPFLLIGCHYLMLKLTASFCSVFGSKPVTEMVSDISSGMGLLLGMTGAVCLLLLIGVICYLRVVL